MIINPYAFGVAIDPDAQAFLTAAGITDATITSAINTLTLSLKANNLWTKMKAIYPFVGGTASTHKWNLKDPRDLDVAFRLVFNGGFTHSINGIAGNGTNGFADTKFNPISQLSVQNNFSISIYSRTNLAAAQFDIGNSDFWPAGTKGTNIVTLYSNNNRYINIANNNYVTLNPDTNSLGFYCGLTNGSSTQILYKNGINVLSGTSTQSGFSNFNLYISAVNELNIAQQYSSKQYAFSSIGEGLSATEASNFYTAVQTLQTSLSRQV